MFNLKKYIKKYKTMQNETESNIQYVEFEEIKEDDTNVIKWYQDIFPYTEMLKTSDVDLSNNVPFIPGNYNGNVYLFALLLHGKLVAIGMKDKQDEGVFDDLQMIFKTSVHFKERLKKALYGKHAKTSLYWIALNHLIRGKQVAGKLELPPQPKKMIYRKVVNDNNFIVYQNLWNQPKKFSLWSGDEQTSILDTDDIKDINKKLLELTNLQINLI